MNPHGHDLEALARGELGPAAAAEARYHVDGCGECRQELGWLEAERALIAARRREAPADRAALDRMWGAIERQTGVGGSGPARVRGGRPRLGFAIGTATMVAVAAAVLFLAVPRGGEPVLDPRLAATGGASTIDAGAGAVDDLGAPPSPAGDGDRLAEAERAVRDAEQAYGRALDALEADYRARRGGLDAQVASAYDARFESTRRELDQARQEAAGDLDARVLVLDLYAGQVRSLRGDLRRLDRVTEAR